jgi:acyl-CoA thioesterase
LIAEAVCLKDGRTTAYYEIRIKDELGNTAAVVSTTGYKLTKL